MLVVTLNVSKTSIGKCFCGNEYFSCMNTFASERQVRRKFLKNHSKQPLIAEDN